MPVAAPPASLAPDLSRAVGRLRRALNRRVRAATGTSPLPEAQMELLRLVEHRPRIRVQDAASELLLAPNTVSTLVHRLVEAGLLEREPDPADARVARLIQTAAGAELRRLWRDQRHEILAAQLSDLNAGDLDALARAVPILAQVAEGVEAGTHLAPTDLGAVVGL